MMVVKEIAQVLQNYGGWGLSSLLMVALWYLYRSTSKILEKRNQQLIEVIRDCGTAMSQATDTSKDVEVLLQENKAFLERNQRLITRMEIALDRRSS